MAFNRESKSRANLEEEKKERLERIKKYEQERDKLYATCCFFCVSVKWTNSGWDAIKGAKYESKIENEQRKIKRIDSQLKNRVNR